MEHKEFRKSSEVQTRVDEAILLFPGHLPDRSVQMLLYINVHLSLSLKLFIGLMEPRTSAWLVQR